MTFFFSARGREEALNECKDRNLRSVQEMRDSHSHERPPVQLRTENINSGVRDGGKTGFRIRRRNIHLLEEAPYQMGPETLAKLQGTCLHRVQRDSREGETA